MIKKKKTHLSKKHAKLVPGLGETHAGKTRPLPTSYRLCDAHDMKVVVPQTPKHPNVIYVDMFFSGQSRVVSVSPATPHTPDRRGWVIN